MVGDHEVDGPHMSDRPSDGGAGKGLNIHTQIICFFIDIARKTKHFLCLHFWLYVFVNLCVDGALLFLLLRMRMADDLLFWLSTFSHTCFNHQPTNFACQPHINYLICREKRKGMLRNFWQATQKLFLKLWYFKSSWEVVMMILT